MAAITDKTKSADDSEKSWGVQKKVGRRWQLNFFKKLISFAGRRPAYHIMYIVTLWYVLFNSSIRRRTRYYLDKRFPERTGIIRRFMDSYRLVYTFGRTLIDRAAFHAPGSGGLSASCPNAEDLLKIVREGKGAIMLNAHIGCWQVAISSLNFLERPVSCVMIPPGKNSPIAEISEKGPPFKIIDPRKGFESVLEMMQTLRRGEILGLMGDRVFGSNEETVSANFLGHRIHLPYAPYRLAGAANVPILAIFSRKVDYRRYEVWLAKVIHVPAMNSRDPKACEPYAQQFADTLEEYAQKHPWQVFNFYDLWSENPHEFTYESDADGGAA